MLTYDYMNDLITLAGNSSIVYASVGVVFLIGRKIVKSYCLPQGHESKLSKDALYFSIGMLIWGIGEAFRIGWWVPAIFFKEFDQNYANYAEDLRPFMMLIATPFLVTGVALTLRELKGQSIGWMVSFISSAFIFGWGIALLWHLMK